MSFLDIELLRRRMLQDQKQHNCEYASKNKVDSIARTFKEVARNSAVKPRYGRLLYRLVAYFKPATILEVGTSLGLSSMYIGKAMPGSSFITMEGCKTCAAMAQHNIETAGLDSVEVVNNEFGQMLPQALNRLKKVDFAFIDGNHRKTAVLDYFEKIFPFTDSGSVLVFDDIHWSPGMEAAWRMIRTDSRISITIDLYFLGLVFFKEGQAKQDFVLRF